MGFFDFFGQEELSLSKLEAIIDDAEHAQQAGVSAAVAHLLYESLPTTLDEFYDHFHTASPEVYSTMKYLQGQKLVKQEDDLYMQAHDLVLPETHTIPINISTSAAMVLRMRGNERPMNSSLLGDELIVYARRTSDDIGTELLRVKKQSPESFSGYLDVPYTTRNYEFSSAKKLASFASLARSRNQLADE